MYKTLGLIFILSTMGGRGEGRGREEEWKKEGKRGDEKEEEERGLAHRQDTRNNRIGQDLHGGFDKWWWDNLL